MEKTKIIVIVGPTAVGKTTLSLELAKKYNGEIISGDAFQIYKKLDIATAKIMPNQQQGIAHHLIDIAEMTERYTVYDFQQQARLKIAEITKRGQIPVIVGGTGLYLQALLYDLKLGTHLQKEQNFKIRQKWQSFLQTHGQQELWQALNAIDPAAAKQIPQNNTRRVIRAIEVFETTGTLFSKQPEPKLLYDAFIIGLNTERSLLYERINQRVDEMMRLGLINEAKMVYTNKAKSFQASKAIGYKEFFPYFENEIDLDQAIRLVKRNSRHYAKRQLTWFNHQMAVNWFDLVQNYDAEMKRLEQQITAWQIQTVGE